MVSRRSSRRSSKRRSSKRRSSRRSSKRRSNPTKGWAKIAPQAGKARHSMMNRCGKRCFLLPNKRTPGESKFPVCAKNTCTTNCKGLLSAYIRARQWRNKNSRYRKVASVANRRYKSKCCKSKNRSKSRCAKKRSRRR